MRSREVFDPDFSQPRARPALQNAVSFTPPPDRVAMEVVNLRNPLYPAERDRQLARRKSAKA